MDQFIRVAVVIMAVVLTASVFGLALSRLQSSRSVAFVTAASAILLAPYLVAGIHTLSRFIVAVVGVVAVSKLFDVRLASGCEAGPGGRRLLIFLLNPFCFVERRLVDEPVPTPGANAANLVMFSAVFAAPYVSMWFVDWGSLTAGSFFLEHSTKTVLAMVAVFGGCAMSIAIWRLLGMRGRDPMRNFFLSRTPAEFWNRYNRLAGQLLELDVFRPLTRRISPLAAVLAVFAASGLVHEYVFGIAAGGRFGYQMAFFVLQGAAVALTARLKPRGWKAAASWAMTMAFMLGSSILFFTGWHRVVPFYSGAAPPWTTGP